MAPVAPPYCANREKHPRVRKMVEVETKRSTRANARASARASTRARRKHVASQVCSSCNEVMVAGCCHERPCKRCRDQAGKTVSVARTTCDQCKGAGQTKIGLEPVESSNIEAAGYNSKRRIFAVRFKSGRVYEHSGVPHQTYSTFLKAESKGKAYNRLIKERFPVREIG